MNPLENFPEMKLFQRKVLEATLRVPAGKVTTYQAIAKRIESRAYQAIGQALRRNPLPITIPCHRIVKSDLSLGGFLGDQTERKLELLQNEGVFLDENGKIPEKFVIKTID